MIVKPSTFILTLIFLLSIYSVNGQSVEFTELVRNSDLSSVIFPDSITDDAGERFKRPEILAAVDSSYERFYIHFTEIKKSASNQLEYAVKGKTRSGKNVYNFKGLMNIEAIIPMQDMDGYETIGVKSIGYMNIAIHLTEEYSKNYTISGNLHFEFLVDSLGEIQYDAFMLIADGYSNNQFTGYRYTKNGRKATCNWGDFRIPNSGELDGGTGEFIINKKYASHGWQNYIDAWGYELTPEQREVARKEELREWWK